MMQMIYDAISDERLSEFKKLMEAKGALDHVREAARLDEDIRKQRDRQAEDADRSLFASRHERRKAKALAR